MQKALFGPDFGFLQGLMFVQHRTHLLSIYCVPGTLLAMTAWKALWAGRQRPGFWSQLCCELGDQRTTALPLDAQVSPRSRQTLGPRNFQGPFGSSPAPSDHPWKNTAHGPPKTGLSPPAPHVGWVPVCERTPWGEAALITALCPP